MLKKKEESKTIAEHTIIISTVIETKVLKKRFDSGSS